MSGSLRQIGVVLSAVIAVNSSGVQYGVFRSVSGKINFYRIRIIVVIIWTYCSLHKLLIVSCGTSHVIIINNILPNNNYYTELTAAGASDKKTSDSSRSICIYFIGPV